MSFHSMTASLATAGAEKPRIAAVPAAMQMQRIVRSKRVVNL
jgi:hypothetical protein